MKRTCHTTGWPLERVLFAMAGSAALVSAAVSPWYLLITVFAGVKQWSVVAAGACPVSIVLTRVFGLRAASTEVTR